MGAFDDLIEEVERGKRGAAPTSTGAFDDLIAEAQGTKGAFRTSRAPEKYKGKERAAQGEDGPEPSQLARETDDFEAGLIRTGYNLSKLGRGVKQKYLEAVAAIPGAELMTAPAKRMLAEMAAEETDVAPRMEDLRRAHPKASFWGDVAATAPFGVAGRGVSGAMASGALPGLVEYGDARDNLVAGGAGAAGGAAGVALGKLLGTLVSRRGGRELLDPERAELVRLAQEAGYSLRPDQITGKTWQKNLAGALSHLPGSSGVMDAQRAANQATTERLVDIALGKAGGPITQPEAAAAATRGIAAGVKREDALIDQAYRDVLQGVDVDLTGTRPPLTRILEEQGRLPADVASGKAVRSLETMLGGPEGGTLDAVVTKLLSPDKLRFFEKVRGQLGDDAALSMLPKADQAAIREATQAQPRGYIRDNPKVPGEIAQDIRSGYRVKADEALAKGDAQGVGVFSRMKATIDDAIEAAVPAKERGQFDAVNSRYGLGMAVRLLPKRDSQQFLSQIYRGFGSADEFAAFVAMSPDKEFREVARGFLSDVVERAGKRSKEGLTAANVGRELRGRDKDALRVLGGESGKDLALVGRVGEELLPDIPNSQTANRLLWQGLLTGGGGLAGGAGGAEGFDVTGGAVGAAAGALLVPRVAAKAYLSDTARRVLTGPGVSYPGVPGLRDLSPEVAEGMMRLPQALGVGTAAGATSQ